MYCKECGSEINDDTVFCPSCGIKVVVKNEMPTMEELTLEMPEQPELPELPDQLEEITQLDQIHEPVEAEQSIEAKQPEQSIEAKQPEQSIEAKQPEQARVAQPITPQPTNVTRQALVSYEPMTLSAWLITFLILCVPVVNLVMPFVWAFGSATHPSKKTFFQAYLIFAVIAVILWVIFVFAAVLIFTTTVDSGLFY